MSGQPRPDDGEGATMAQLSDAERTANKIARGLRDKARTASGAEADELWEQALATPGVDRRLWISHRHDAAKHFWYAGNPHRAEELYREAVSGIDVDPLAGCVAAASYGRFLVAQERPDEAIDVLTRALITNASQRGPNGIHDEIIERLVAANRALERGLARVPVDRYLENLAARRIALLRTLGSAWYPGYGVAQLWQSLHSAQYSAWGVVAAVVEAPPATGASPAGDMRSRFLSALVTLTIEWAQSLTASGRGKYPSADASIRRDADELLAIARSYARGIPALEAAASIAIRAAARQADDLATGDSPEFSAVEVRNLIAERLESAISVEEGGPAARALWSGLVAMSDVSPSLRTRILYDAGHEFEDLPEPDLAQKCYRDAFSPASQEANPKFAAQAGASLGRILMSLGENEEAFAILATALRVNASVAGTDGVHDNLVDRLGRVTDRLCSPLVAALQRPESPGDQLLRQIADLHLRAADTIRDNWLRYEAGGGSVRQRSSMIEELLSAQQALEGLLEWRRASPEDEVRAHRDLASISCRLAAEARQAGWSATAERNESAAILHAAATQDRAVIETTAAAIQRSPEGQDQDLA